MIIGTRAHDFGKLPADELAKKIADKGLKCVQLAVPRAIEGIDNDMGKLNPGMAWHIKEAFRKQGVQISVLGCYINPIDTDKVERRKQLDRFKEYIRFARDFGCSIVGTETGSINRDFSYHPDNRGEEAFNTLVESVAELVAEAEKFGVFVGIEGVINYVVHTPQRMKRLIDTINSNNMQIIFDPVNYLCIDNYKEQDRIINESFELFGDKIQIIHAKDFIVENNSIKCVQIGEGMLNYELIMKHLKERKPFINVLIEEAVVDKVQNNIEFMNKVYNKA